MGGIDLKGRPRVAIGQKWTFPAGYVYIVLAKNPPYRRFFYPPLVGVVTKLSTVMTYVVNF